MRIIIIFLLFLPLAYAQPYKYHLAMRDNADVSSENFYGQLTVQNTQLSDAAGKPVMLRGTSFGWHNWWPQFYNAEAVRWLKEDWHVNLVRAAMGVAPGGGFLSNPFNSEATITAVVDAAIANNLYVIIDWHSHNIKTKEAVLFFTTMAKRYAGVPNVLYEIFNEPEYQSWPEVKAYSEEVIAAIRKHDKDNIILVGSPHWSQDVDIAAEDPITGYQNIMYTLHFYAGSHKGHHRQKAENALAKQLPIFVSECGGMEATGHGPLHTKSWQTWVEWMEDKDISYAIWSVTDKEETCSMLKPGATATGHWQAADLTPWGVKVRALIREKQGKDAIFD